MSKARFVMLVILGLAISIMTACNGNETEEMSQGTMDMEEDKGGMAGMNDVPADLDLSTSKETDEGLFQATITSELDPLVINQIHSWIVHLETNDGMAVEGAELILEGGMPQHDHGFPTAPEVTDELGDGDYRIEGVKFNMSGWWEFTLSINAGDQSDSVTFNLILPQ